MKSFISLSLLLINLTIAIGQDSRKATDEDAAFHNRIMDAMLKTFPTSFREWDITIRDKDRSPMAKGDYIDYCEGTTCWRDEQTVATYDGSQVKDDFYIAAQKEVEKLDKSAPDYMQKVTTLLNKFDNDTHLEVTILINYPEVGPLTYCRPGEYKKLTPPAGWNSFYTSSAYSCNQDMIMDISILSIGLIPQLKESKDELNYVASLSYPLNKAFLKSYKVQNIVLHVKGSKKVAEDYVKKIDTSELLKLLK